MSSGGEEEVASRRSPTPERKEEPVAAPQDDQEGKGDVEEAQEAAVAPHPVQFIVVDDDGLRFTLDEGLLSTVLGRAPPNMRVSIVSIVGRFRTGKSFMLDLMLRFLYNSGDGDWFEGSGDKLGGSNNDGADGDSAGFLWRHGKERQTTGMWIWSHPFIRKLDSGEEVAVFLLDTQGMFDSKTGQMLTACIFGLSTLISSYQIYNVERRIGEDNLQHLALFSEYGRIGGSQSQNAALFDDDDEEDEDQEDNVDGADDGDDAPADDPVPAAAGAGASAGDPMSPAEVPPPFQTLEFLVRDAPLEIEDDMAQNIKEMEDYLESVLSQTHSKDLQQTREQIASCFERVSCFELPHPGFAVEERKYDGDVSVLRPEFKMLAKYYVESLFGASLTPKKVHGQFVNAPQLERFVVSYCGLFQNASIFPAAQDLLSATAEVNNRNARDAAFQHYKSEMDKLAGVGRPFVPEADIKGAHKATYSIALAQFAEAANFGSRRDIRAHRHELIAQMDTSLKDYLQHNRDRDPLKDVEIFAIPLVLFIAAYILDKFTDVLAGNDSAASQFFTNIYSLAFFLLVFIIGTRAQQFTARVKAIMGLLAAVSGGGAGGGGHEKKD